jgi:hypothetical protein
MAEYLAARLPDTAEVYTSRWMSEALDWFDAEGHYDRIVAEGNVQGLTPNHALAAQSRLVLGVANVSGVSEDLA